MTPRSNAAPPFVLLAGGMGTRFGGDKQTEPVGPAGEPLGAYTAFDARAAGFGELVLLTRPGAEEAVRTVFTEALGESVPMRAVAQVHPFPDGTTAPEGRTRPWGTAHATLAAAATIDGPFAVANADDAYGREGLVALKAALDEADDGDVVLVTYPAGSVLSRYGGVSRGWVRRVPHQDGGDRVEVVEVHELRHRTGCAMLEGVTEKGAPVAFAPDTPVSMNLWGLTPGAVAALQDGWREFARSLDEHPSGPHRAEYALSTALTVLAAAGRIRLRPRTGGAHWFGMTFADDLPRVRARLRALHSDGTYPVRLADRSAVDGEAC